MTNDRHTGAFRTTTSAGWCLQTLFCAGCGPDEGVSYFHFVDQQFKEPAPMSTPPLIAGVEHIDVLIVGAGISGIGAAYSLQTAHPGKSYAILEARGATGGTWELFRYPGIRSDSDLHTFGYEFRA